MLEEHFQPLRLKKNEQRRLRAGHLWVFSNEVDVATTPLSLFEVGQAVEIQEASGKVIGTGYVNPHSLICARLVSRDKQHPLSASLIVHRLKVALSLRERLYKCPYYRLVYAESDGLPGLIIDRYAEHAVIQITTAGMERLRENIIAGLEKVLRPATMLLRNDNAIRELENLPLYTEAVKGKVPNRVVIPERGVDFNIAMQTGQKTGWYFDQYENRGWMRRVAVNKRVLDVFSYVGAFGVQAAAVGATEVHCIEASAQMCDLVNENAKRNKLDHAIRVYRSEAFSKLNDLVAAKEHFDVVILDPPAFIKRKKDRTTGTHAYRRVNELAMRVMKKDAILISCSCSYHLSLSDLVLQMQRAARHLSRNLQILGFGHQASDHPIHPSIPETAYLKAVFARVLS